MPKSTTSLPEWQWKWLTSYKLNRLRTKLHSLLHPSDDPRIVFIFGCQRSGTTMLRNFIGFHPAISDHGEGDPPYFWQVPLEDMRYLRLVPNEEIQRLIKKQKSPVVLIKPLHDSQRAAELLQMFTGSRGLWIFRHYREVILSHLNYYKGRYDPLPYLKDLLELKAASWKAEALSSEMKSFISEHMHLATNATAGYALFWLARNSLLFDQIANNLMTVNYADLIEHPQASLRKLSSHIQIDLDPRYALFPQRRERQQPLPDELPKPILHACEQMNDRLVAAAASH